MSKPIILFGSIERAGDQGDSIYNGGFKLQSVWIKLLRQHGHEAYRVTGDGTQLPWMIEHQPAISLQQANKLANVGKPLRVVTTWIISEPILKLADRPYYFDAEIAHTSNGRHFEALKRWLPKLAKIGTHSRTQQAWYMATLGLTPSYIQEWSDTTYFTPEPALRERGLVGYMWEGDHTPGHIEVIKRVCETARVDVRFKQVGGSEQEVITSMRHCDVFLGLNIGKHVLWGEGCPRSQNESIHCGAVLLAYDCHGNREFVMDGYTGFLAKRADPVSMGERLVYIMTNHDIREAARSQGQEFMCKMFAPTETKYQQIREFLDL